MSLLSRMRALLPKEHQKCLFLRYAFLGQLPSDVRSHLVHDKTADIAILSQRADKIYRSSLSSSLSVNAVDSVHAVNTPPSRQNRRVQHSDRASSPITHCSQTPAAHLHLHHLFAGTMPSLVQRPSAVKLHVPGRFNEFCSHLPP